MRVCNVTLSSLILLLTTLLLPWNFGNKFMSLQSQSYFTTTGSPPISLSWRHAP
jgi:hypothetical protein